MSNVTIPKEFKTIIDPFLKTGCVSLERKSRHVAVVVPSGRKHIIPGSPGDHRSLANFRSQFRRFLREANIEAAV